MARRFGRICLLEAQAGRMKTTAALSYVMDHNINRFLRFLGAALLPLIFPFILFGQIQPKFEVVAIKPAGELTPDSTLGLNTDGAQTHISWASMTDLITMAYRIKRYQV